METRRTIEEAAEKNESRIRIEPVDPGFESTDMEDTAQ